MQRSNRKTNNKKRGRNGLTREYAAPILRKLEKPVADITLTYATAITSGSTGINGILTNVFYPNFSDLAEFVGVYKYFEITGYKLDFSLSTTTAALDSFNAAAIGINPLNYVLFEAAGTTVPSKLQAVSDLPGAIFVQEGGNNRGKWCPPASKQVYNLRDAFTNSRQAFDILTYVDDIGNTETVGYASVMMNFKFYGKEFAATF